MLRTILLASTLALTSTVALAGSYQDAMHQCGAEWRSSDARKTVAKGEGAAAWNAFRSTCTRRVGWDRKVRPASASPGAERPAASPAPNSPGQAS